MQTTAINLPVVGQPNATEQPKVRQALIDLQAAGNSNATDAEYAFATWKPLIQRGTAVTGNLVADTYGLTTTGTGTQSVTNNPIGNSGSLAATYFQLDPADYAVPGRTVKYRLRGVVVAAGTAPGCTFSIQLFQVTGLDGFTAASYHMNLTSVSTFNANFAAPLAGSINTQVAAEFTAPAAGLFLLGVQTNATTPAASVTNVVGRLEMRQV